MTSGPTGGRAATREHPGSRQLELAGTPPSARSAAPLPVLDDARQRGTTFHEVPVKAILNSPATTGMGFWSLNPYVGCEFGCTYCYARETHKWRVERSEESTESKVLSTELKVLSTESKALSTESSQYPPWLAFEKRILVKTTAAAVLKRTLFPAKLAGSSLVIGTATDPYQPAERRFRLTRSILEALLGWRGLSLGLITKSPLVARDIDLLVRLAERHELSVNISIASADAEVLRRLEARSPAPHARLRALKQLTSAGIHAGMLIAPVVPGITDSRESLAALMAAGKAAGAQYAVGMALRLGPTARARFLPHLAREFPELASRYEQHYAHRQQASLEYREALAARIRALQQEYGFPIEASPRRRHHKDSTSPAAPAPIQWELPVLA